MIPVLYESSEVSFTSNGLGRLRDCISCIVTEERNGIYECDFEYPINGAHYGEITLGRIIAVTHDDTNDIQPFDIVSFEKNIEGTTTFHCTHISYRQSYLTVSGTNINSLSAALSALSSAEPSNPFTYTTDKTSAGYVAAFDGIPRTVRSLLGGVEGSILDTFGGEYEWNKFNVILHAARGTLQDFSIRYGVNMTEYNNESGIEGTFSSCVPYWTDGTDTVKGNRVDSTYTTASGRNDCVPLDLSEKFEDKPTAVQLQTLALSIMQSEQTYIPTQTISVSFVRLQDSPEYVQFSNLLQCKLCDSVKVIFPDYNTSGNFKIVKVEWDALQERYNEMELGSLSTTLSEALGIEDALDKQNTKETSGSQSNDYTCAFTLGDCTIISGSTTINVTTANTNTDKAVTFGTGIQFKYNPAIQCTMLNIGGSYYQRVTAAGPSTTGFTARIRAGGTPGNVTVVWVAIGELV